MPIRIQSETQYYFTLQVANLLSKINNPNGDHYSQLQYTNYSVL